MASNNGEASGGPEAPALHHIGILVKDIAVAAEEFVSRLGYIIESEVIEDPVQTALVQFIRQPGTPFWLELVTPNGPDSKLSRAVRKGGGTHHLCYQTDDMDALCEHLRERKMLMLAEAVDATAFAGRKISWFMDQGGLLIEIVEGGEGPLSLASMV